MLPISSGSRRYTGTSVPAALVRRRNRLAVEPQPQLLRRLLLVRKAEIAHEHVDRLALAAERARSVDRHLRDIAEAGEFLGEAGGGETLPDVQLERLRIDACRQRPATAFELLRDAAVEHGDQHDRGQQAQQRNEREAALQLAAGRRL